MNAKLKLRLFAKLDCNTVAIVDPVSSPQRTMPISLINYGQARAAGLSIFKRNAKTRRILPIIRRLRNARLGSPLSTVRSRLSINYLSLGFLILFPYFFARVIVS